MTSAARDAILARVRAARTTAGLTPVAPPGPYPVPPPAAGSRRERFLAQVAASGAAVVTTTSRPPWPADAVFDGVLGVAESGAVWVVPASSAARQQLFLAEHVTLVVGEETLVDTLHDAYAALDVAAASFGCFVAGPSKTADIEQTLVIGAHGPLALTVVLVGPGDADRSPPAPAGRRTDAGR